MADNNPNLPTGGVPPKPPEPSKVQPKKETVRISLPPKPTATIKLPTLPPGGPAVSHPRGVGVVAPPPAAGAPQAPRPAAAGAPTSTSAPAHRPGPAAPASLARPPAAPMPAARPAPPAHGVAAKRVSGLDVVLAIAAALVALGAVGYLFLGILSMN